MLRIILYTYHTHYKAQTTLDVTVHKYENEPENGVKPYRASHFTVESLKHHCCINVASATELCGRLTTLNQLHPHLYGQVYNLHTDLPATSWRADVCHSCVSVNLHFPALLEVLSDGLWEGLQPPAKGPLSPRLFDRSLSQRARGDHRTGTCMLYKQHCFSWAWHQRLKHTESNEGCSLRANTVQ